MSMKITKKFREHFVKEFSVDANAEDSVFEEAARKAVSENKIDLPSLMALCEEEKDPPKEKSAAEKLMEMVDSRVNAGVEERLKKLNAPVPAAGGDGADADGNNPAGEKQLKIWNSLVDLETVGNNQSNLGSKSYALAQELGDYLSSGGDVKSVSVLDQYDDSRVTATWDKSSKDHQKKGFAGRSITSHMEGPGSESFDMPNDRSKFISGVWFKWLIHKNCQETGRQVPRVFRMKEREKKAVAEIAHTCRFVGPVGYEGTGAKNYSDGATDTDNAKFWCEGEKLSDGWQIKAVLDDTISGGLEAVPIEFDAAVILTPLLNGELFPLVSVTNVTRRRIEASKVGNPTMYWGSSEGSAIDLFDTDSYISAFDKNIYPITGAMELGRDFLSDSPLDIGSIVQQRYGQVFLQEMDNVIANGNGTNRPEGIFTTSGVSTIASAGGAGAAPEVGDYEALYLDIGKAFRDEGGDRFAYVGTDTSYKRSKGIPVDSSNDARRIFGYNLGDYRIFEKQYRVNNGIGNANIAGVMMNRYRLYRRQGLEVRIVRDDRESVLRNTELIALRARFGGGLDHSSAMVKITDAQA